MINPVLATLARTAGIHFMGVEADFQIPEAAINYAIAMDAQPQLVTLSNSGIPAFLSTLVDPKIIKVLVTPMQAAEVAGEEVKKGDWITKTAMFPVVESTGETSAYGDYSNNGVAGANVNWENRQSFHYQVITQWGEMELETMGLGRIDWANQLSLASVLTLNKFQNASYFFGIAGLENYGLLNDPALSAPIPPTTETGGLILWRDKDALGVVADIAALFTQLQSQAKGLVNLKTPMTLAMSPIAEAEGMTKTNNFNVNVPDILKKNYPNLKIVTAPEYSTASGELVQLKADNVEAQQTVSVAFTEKLRAHPVVTGLSSWQQKKSQGTWGAIYFRPFLVAQMLGV